MEHELIEDLNGFSGKYLTINLKEELFGISVRHIMQIIAIPEITPIPKTPDHIKGVINLRGKIIPVIDLRTRFNLPFEGYNDRTSIVIVKLKLSQSDLYIGIIVDKVNEVLDIHLEELEKTPSFGITLNTEFIQCMAKVKDKVVTLLDINRVLTEDELKLIS